MSDPLEGQPWRVDVGDALAVLRGLPDGCVQCCVTSPPYYALRDYGTAKWEGGDAACDHKQARGTTRGGPHSTLTGGQDTEPHVAQYRDLCGKCGARRVDAQLGLEATPALYVARMVEVFREVRRILRPDGTLWLNIGDSYAGGGRGGNTHPKCGAKSNGSAGLPGPVPDGTKPKDLLGIPWLLAFALRDDGWYLRSEVIWAKVSPMPESVRDRPTRAHEQVFLFAKGPRYFYDQEAERVGLQGPESQHTRPREIYNGTGRTNRWGGDSRSGAMQSSPAGRNLWSYWNDIPPSPDSAGHFALMPLALAARCVRLGTPAYGCCPACGAPWARVVKRRGDRTAAYAHPKGNADHLGLSETSAMRRGGAAWKAAGHATETLGWRPGCACPPHEPAGSLVLDPFSGMATTGLAARHHGRRYLGIELSPTYAEQSRRRLAEAAPLLDHHDRREAAMRQQSLFHFSGGGES